MFPLEEECIQAVTNYNYNDNDNFNLLLRQLRGKKEWIKMPSEFKKKYKHFLKQKMQAWAYNYMNFHTIKYICKSKELMAYCYHKNDVVYKEPIKRSYVRHVENFHRQYMMAIKFPNNEVALNIGKGNDSSRKQKILLRRRKNNQDIKQDSIQILLW